MAEYKLHCVGESGNAYKVALALELARCDWAPQLVNLFAGATRSPEFLALNPMGEIPVLTHNGQNYTQSGAILDYLSTQTGQFSGKDTDESRAILRWILWDNHKLSTQIGTCRFQQNFLPPEKRPEAVISFLHARLKPVYHTLNTHLADNEWLVGGRITNADISCCGYLYYPEPYGFERASFEHIDRWLNQISNLPNWKPPYDLMPKGRT